MFLWVTVREGEGWLDKKIAILEAFLPTRILMSCLPTCIWADAITDVSAIFDFAVPSDGGPTNVWWTALSSIALLSAFRLQMIRVILWLREMPFEYRFTYIVKCSVPGYGLTVAFDFHELEWEVIVTWELLLLVVSLFYPLILVGEVIYLIRENWRRTGKAKKTTKHSIGIAVLEMVESVSQLAIQCRAFSVGALKPNVFWLSFCFSVIGILKALVIWILNYEELSTGVKEYVCEGSSCFWVDMNMRSLPLRSDVLGQVEKVVHIELSGNILGSVNFAEWDTFLKTFPKLRNLHVTECEIRHPKPLCQALKNCHSLKEVGLGWNNLPYSYKWIREFCVALEDNKTLRECNICFNWETEEDQILVGEALASNKVIQTIHVGGRWEREVHGFELQKGSLRRMQSASEKD